MYRINKSSFEVDNSVESSNSEDYSEEDRPILNTERESPDEFASSKDLRFSSYFSSVHVSNEELTQSEPDQTEIDLIGTNSGPLTSSRIHKSVKTFKVKKMYIKINRALFLNKN